MPCSNYIRQNHIDRSTRLESINECYVTLNRALNYPGAWDALGVVPSTVTTVTIAGGTQDGKEDNEEWNLECHAMLRLSSMSRIVRNVAAADLPQFLLTLIPRLSL